MVENVNLRSHKLGLKYFYSNGEREMKILVVFYTRTNHTKSVADSIGAKCSADILQIKDARRSTGVLNYLTIAKDAILKRQGGIQPVNKNAAEYDLIILGTPVWAFSLSSPMRTYITEQSDSFKQVAFFCTEGGSGGANAFDQMSKIIGQSPVATMEVTEADFQTGTDKIKLELFIDAISRLTANSKLQ